MTQRVLYLSRTWAMGGAQSILLALIGHLPRDQFEILVVPYDTGSAPDAAFAAAAEAAGARLTRPVPWRGWRSFPAARAALAGIVREEGAALVHSHDNLSSALVGFSRGALGTPALATAYGWWELNLKLKALYAAERALMLPRFDAVVTVSQDMAGKLRRGGVPARKIEVIHTGLDARVWAPRGRREAARRRFGLAQDAPVLGAVGRISHEKGHDVLLAAMARLRPRWPNLVALLAGTGPDLARLRSIAEGLGLSDALVTPGYVADATEALEALDIAVLPSVLEEGFPTASMEAQAMGLPIVASDIGGTRETLVEGVTGLLAAPGDAEALAGRLSVLLGDPARRVAMGQAARARIASDFTMAGMLERYAALYARLGGAMG